MIISRGVFGMGGENLIITTSSLISRWFKGRELSFASGLNLSIARISGTINNSSQLLMYKASGNRLHLGYFVGLLLTVYTVVCSVASFVMDRKADQSEGSMGVREKNVVRLSDVAKFTVPYWLLTAGCFFFYIGFYPFMNVVSEMLQKRYAISSVNAGFLMVQF
eukprot:TRINITY_DN2139_c0_g1_i5.p1 TRINITY_DN2139_c0_g1~~TRINITY_DN2139_c0_g1_i5.p1  ORF type:complete len:164 (-),score=37.56 TRINITY_DN2139_c0_g1_i5:706-1197(-)